MARNSKNAVSSTLESDQLGSKWDGLNKYLLAHIYPVDKDGIRKQGLPEVIAPATEETTIEATLNWHSPFEQTGADSVKPMITSMLQAGTLQPIMDSLIGKADSFTSLNDGTIKLKEKTVGYLDTLTSRTGMTKLNSRQTFVGAPPMRIQTTLYFRAFSDPISEVHKPLDMLWNYSLPRVLASNSIESLTNIKDNASAEDYLQALMPSIAPFLLAFQYKRRTLAPIVIESISEPMNSPITEDGHYTQMAVTLSLATLTALDANDWNKIAKQALI